ncbi:hypothetical protein DM02DRAFT_627914 [Periconia macrospinosa]|uniref:Uncharacterized protein n=1 Tax=Periconia macrospinosa TaxID=97972 RepID=A0A2V1DSK1_9PLEO|nr:hypothetical protein DM02DRAFT_627914 [Periconia macrospinosa]
MDTLEARLIAKKRQLAAVERENLDLYPRMYEKQSEIASFPTPDVGSALRDQQPDRFRLLQDKTTEMINAYPRFQASWRDFKTRLGELRNLDNSFQEARRRYGEALFNLRDGFRASEWTCVDSRFRQFSAARSVYLGRLRESLEATDRAEEWQRQTNHDLRAHDAWLSTVVDLQREFTRSGPNWLHPILDLFRGFNRPRPICTSYAAVAVAVMVAAAALAWGMRSPPSPTAGDASWMLVERRFEGAGFQCSTDRWLRKRPWSAEEQAGMEAAQRGLLASTTDSLDQVAGFEPINVTAHQQTLDAVADAAQKRLTRKLVPLAAQLRLAATYGRLASDAHEATLGSLRAAIESLHGRDKTPVEKLSEPLLASLQLREHLDLQLNHIRNQSSAVRAVVQGIREDILPDLVPRGIWPWRSRETTAGRDLSSIANALEVGLLGQDHLEDTIWVAWRGMDVSMSVRWCADYRGARFL